MSKKYQKNNSIKKYKNKKILISFGFLSLISSVHCQADPITQLVDLVGQIKGYQQQISGFENTISTDEATITSLTTQIQGALSGKTQWGTQGFTDFQSWGSDAQSWQNVLGMAQNGGGSSALGQQVQQNASQFPINTSLVNSVDPNASDQQYYALQAQTALAARSASQADFNGIQNQITYSDNLVQEINTNTTEIQAADLNSRLVGENNLIQLQILRQLTLLNQQKAVETQGEVNATVKNAQFLNN